MIKGFKKLFGGEDKSKKDEVLFAALKGSLHPMADVPDPTFSQEMLGPGVAIEPSEGKLYAPAAGTVTMVFDTKHALSLTTDGGAELLFHLGLDTVKEQGAGFEAKVEVDDKVKPGDVLIEFDLEGLKAKGYKLITPVILCNKGDFSSIVIAQERFGSEVGPEDAVITLSKG